MDLLQLFYGHNRSINHYKLKLTRVLSEYQFILINFSQGHAKLARLCFHQWMTKTRISVSIRIISSRSISRIINKFQCRSFNNFNS